jgi:hypothetical protein
VFRETGGQFVLGEGAVGEMEVGEVFLFRGRDYFQVIYPQKTLGNNKGEA